MAGNPTLEQAMQHVLSLPTNSQTGQSAQILAAELIRLRASLHRELVTGSTVKLSQNGSEFYGLIREVESNGTLQIPDTAGYITGTEDVPVALMEIFILAANGEWTPTGRHVGEKLSSFEEIEAFPLPTPRQAAPAVAAPSFPNESELIAGIRAALKQEFVGRFQSMARDIKELQQAQQRGLLFEQVVDQVYDYLWSNQDTWQMWVHAFYWENGQLFIITSDNGRLMRAPLTIGEGTVSVGEFEMVEVEFTPAGGGEADSGEEAAAEEQAKKLPRMRSHIIRQAGKRSLHLRCSSVSILNRSGQLDSSTMFQRMVDNANETGQMPYRDIFHLGEEFIVGRALGVWADGFTLLELVELEDGPEDSNVWAKVMSRALEAEPEFWGDSIEFLPRAAYELCDESTGVCVTVFNDATHLATTFLPEEMAASLYTFGTVLAGSNSKRGINRMNKSTKDAILALISDHADDADKAEMTEQVEAFDEQHRAVMANLQSDAKKGAVIRAVPPQKREEAPAAQTPAPAAALATAPTVEDIVRGIVGSDTFKGITQGITENSQAITEIRQRLQQHSDTLAQLSGTAVEQQRHKQDAPPITQSGDVAFRPSQHAPVKGSEVPRDLSAVAAASRKKWQKEGEESPV